MKRTNENTGSSTGSTTTKSTNLIKTAVCRCNKCGGYFQDTNPSKESAIYEVDNSMPELEDMRCPVCEDDAYLMDCVSSDVLPLSLSLTNEQANRIVQVEEEGEFTIQHLINSNRAKDVTPLSEDEVSDLISLGIGDYAPIGMYKVIRIK